MISFPLSPRIWVVAGATLVCKVNRGNARVSRRTEIPSLSENDSAIIQPLQQLQRYARPSKLLSDSTAIMMTTGGAYQTQFSNDDVCCGFQLIAASCVASASYVISMSSIETGIVFAVRTLKVILRRI